MEVLAEWETLGRMRGSRHVRDAILSMDAPVECGDAIVSLCDNVRAIPVANRPRRSSIVGTFLGDPVALDDYGNVYIGKCGTWYIGQPPGSRDITLTYDGTIVDTIPSTGLTDIHAMALARKWGCEQFISSKGQQQLCVTHIN